MIFFLRHMKLGFRVSSDLYSDNFYTLSKVNAEALVGEAGDVVFKGKLITVHIDKYPSI